jgi:predicted nucleic acid-binding protein
MAEVVADASVWISYFHAPDALHAPTRAWFGAWLVQRNRVIAPALLLPEVGGGIARRSGQAVLGHRAVTMLRTRARIDIVDLDRALAEDAARLAVALGIRGADAVYVALAQRLSLPLVTWDQEQLTRGAAVVQTRTP